MVKNRSTLWYTALIIGWSFDLLYWGKPLGISLGQTPGDILLYPGRSAVSRVGYSFPPGEKTPCHQKPAVDPRDSHL